MKRTNTQSIGKALDEFLEQNPFLSDKLAENRLIDSWTAVLGHSISRFTSHLYIKNRILYVKLTSSVLKNELMLSREQLIKRLNGAVNRNVIDNIILI
jgi:predicted nucleic acid-binding Zn ribbon protein